MKSPKTPYSSVENNLSIPEAEEMIEEALNELAFSQDPGMVRALHYLAPPGYQAIVELCSDNGRSKRRNASADTWSPEEDEVRIYFERVGDAEPAARPARAQRSAPTHAAPAHAYDEDDTEPEAIAPADLDARVTELCTALAEAERGAELVAPRRDRRGRWPPAPCHPRP